MFKAQLLALVLTLYVQNAFSGLLPSQNFVGELTPEVIKQFRENFDSDKRNTLSQNICIKNDPLMPCESNKIVRNTSFFFEHELTKAWPITDQGKSSKGWIYAGLNAMRLPFMEYHKLMHFEFSQAYLLFWHKIENSNTFLHRIVKATKDGERLEDLLVTDFLFMPTTDKGDWNMFASLIDRYGVVPKMSFPESWSSKTTDRLNSLLNSKLREYSNVLMKLVEDGASDDAIKNKIDEQMEVVFRIVGICLGVPSETITWEYQDQVGKYHRIGPITGLDFYKNHVKPYYNVDDKVSLTTDPRASTPFGHLYEAKYSGYSPGGSTMYHINQPVEVLMNVTAKSIMNNEAVFFVCDDNKIYRSQHGIFDLNLYDMESIFGTNIQLGLSKADRILYRESRQNHAMVFNGVHFDAEGKVEKFRVENSRGAENGQGGYQVMTADWFNEYVFQVVVDKKFVSNDVLDVFNQIPVPLSILDPMN